MDLNGDSAGAVKELHKAIAEDPGSAEFHFNLGVVLESRGDYEGAIGPLAESVRLSHGRNWRCFAELGKALNKTGRRDAAVQALEQGIAVAEQAHAEEAVGELRKALGTLKGTRSGRSF
jgi:Flp pilus assembly protein TadD